MLQHTDLADLLAATTLEARPQQEENTTVSPSNQDASSSRLPQDPELGVILQSSCHLHRYTRNESDAHIVERAERLRSVMMGVAIAHGRLTASRSDKGKSRELEEVLDLERLLDGMNIGSSQHISERWPFSISSTSRRLKLDSPAVRFAHGTEYPARLAEYINEVASRHAQKESEVPEPLSQGDLYLCQDSLEALEGALGACCEAVDQLCSGQAFESRRRFVSIRPPGHHCESDNPMGFCWVNNVAVAAAHAHLQHGIDRVVIFDIDLHHGNGTQQIAWRLNGLAHKALTDRQKPSSPRKGSPKKPQLPVGPSAPVLQLFYGSLHDVDSYPCEEMDPTLIANASVNISGGGGSQYVTNVHLEPYESLEDFHNRLYPTYRERLMGPAGSFIRKTSANASKTLVVISAGFDASEHEYASMSRHGAKVPTSFFSRFARDAINFAREHAAGKLLAVLEGGYSQRALCSGAGSFLSGLADAPDISSKIIEDWWTLAQIERYERALSPSTTRGKRAITRKEEPSTDTSWQAPTLAVYSKLGETIPPKVNPTKPKEKQVTPPSSNVRATRSRYNSPAAAAQIVSSFHQSLDKSSAEKDANPLAEAPTASPLNGKSAHTTTFPPATPLIRFTFKAGEKKPQPDFALQQYREVKTDMPAGSEGEGSASE